MKVFLPVSKVNIEDYDDKTGHNSLVVNSNGSSKPDERQVRSDNLISITCSEQGNGQTSDTGYYSSGNHSVGKDGTGMFWNEDFVYTKRRPFNGFGNNKTGVKFRRANRS